MYTVGVITSTTIPNNIKNDKDSKVALRLTLRDNGSSSEAVEIFFMSIKVALFCSIILIILFTTEGLQGADVFIFFLIYFKIKEQQKLEPKRTSWKPQ